MEDMHGIRRDGDGGPITVHNGNGKFKLVPEILEDEKPLKCNRKPAEISYTNHAHYFPYHRFQLYLGYQNEIHRLKRLEAIINGNDVAPLDTYSDEYLKEEFSCMYGGLDKENENFCKLFENFKEGRLEDIREWICFEMDVKENPNMMKSIEISFPDLSKAFTPEELTLFESVAVGPSKLEKEWFILPRKNLSTQEIVALKSKPVNLAFFDPELSNYSVGRVIPPQAISREDRGVSERLAQNIYEIICRHQAGIISNEFLVEYKRKFNYIPNFNGLGYERFIEFLVDINHVVFTQGNGPHNDFMMYPTYLENLISSPMDIFWKIYHKLIVLLQFYDGICKTEELVQCFQKLYYIQIPYVSWGFSSIDEFVVYLVENVKWRNDYYRIEKASVILRTHDAIGHYVVRVNSKREKTLEEHKKFIKTAKMQAKTYHVSAQPGISSDCSTSVGIPSQFVQIGEQIPRESDFLEENSEHECVVVYFNSPNEFELALTPTWDMLSKFVRKWSDVYIKIVSPMDNEGKSTACVNPKLLRPGLLLVIFSEENLEYVRAQYVIASDVPRTHRVHLIDDGGRAIVHEDNMFYMHKSVMNDLRAQAICAGLQSVKPLRNGNGAFGWHKEISDFAYNLMVPEVGNPRFRVKFIKQVNGNLHSWLVSMISCRKSKQDIGQAILNFCKKFPSDLETETATKPGSHTLILARNPNDRNTRETHSKFQAVHPAQCVSVNDGFSLPAQSPSKGTTNAKGSVWDKDWRSSSPSSQNPVQDLRQYQQKTPQYQPRSYADTAASWRTQTQPASKWNSDYSALPASFPTLAESANTKTIIRHPSPGTKFQPSFSYAKAASGRYKK